MNNDYENKSSNETEEALMTQLREHFSDELTPEIKRNLQQARHAALDSLEKPSLLRQNWFAPALGVSAAFALGAGLFWQTQHPDPQFGQIIVQNQELNISDYVYLSEIDEQEAALLDASLNADVDLGFFTWLEGQPEFME